MPDFFYVQCPQCAGRFPCHTEDLWDSGYDLLCPYCGNEFSQEAGVAALKQPAGQPSGQAGARPR